MEILQESRLVKTKVLVFVGFCVVGVILALTIAVGVLANKSQDVIYRTSPVEKAVKTSSPRQQRETQLTSCQKCVKNTKAQNPNLEYARCILEHYPLIDG